MAYGVQLFDQYGVELVGTFTPVFIVDYITTPTSGSRTYAGVKGKTLRVYPLGYVGFGEVFGTPPPTVSVNGNTVTWSNVSSQVPVMMVYE